MRVSYEIGDKVMYPDGPIRGGMPLGRDTGYRVDVHGSTGYVLADIDGRHAVWWTPMNSQMPVHQYLTRERRVPPFLVPQSSRIATMNRGCR